MVKTERRDLTERKVSRDLLVHLVVRALAGPRDLVELECLDLPGALAPVVFLE